ncbi:phage portal protein [Elizabethkingia argentiflava]|uniref:Phage portal protein n=1 Tax=Elizabethkingia argenteiflava TaxID=2681556 RepID=A0A845PSG7_9FLAO|nr:phage portal protein [Elizabethkingia argenteiflava]
MNIFNKISKATKSIWSGEREPNYARLNNGVHSYNYETIRFGLLGLLGSKYYTPQQNLKYYYEKALFLQDCVNLYADFAAQVKIEEVYPDGRAVDNSPYLDFLQEPNIWQNKTDFIKEMVVNTLVYGISVQSGNYFKSGNLRINAQLYNIDFFNISVPEIKNPYVYTRKDIQNLNVIEVLDGGQKRVLKMEELAYFYDTISKRGFSIEGYDSKTFFNPISRIFGILPSIHTILNAQDTMCYLTSNPVSKIISKEEGSIAPLGGKEKLDIERKLNGRGAYGAGIGKIGDIIAAEESLKVLDLTRDNKKLQILEMKENAKDDIRNRYLIPRDFFDDSTYENKQFSEARFILGNVSPITTSWLNEQVNKVPAYFKERGTFLRGTYEHLPSIIEAKTRIKNAGFRDKAESTLKVLEAYEKATQLFPGITYDDFLKDHDLTDFTLD